MFTTGTRSRASSLIQEKGFNQQKTTSEDQDKKYKLVKKLTSHAAEQFRQLDINEYDLNFTEHFEELQYIDDAVTPLIYCAHFGLKEICKFLLRNKTIDVDQETENNKQTALIIACTNGNYEIVRQLILAGAEVNKPNSLNNNPLAAVLYRLVEEEYSFENKKICFLIADFLFKNGADPNWVIEKTKGYSLLHYFCSSKMKMNKTQKLINEQIIQFLLNHEANPEQKTLKDQTAFDLIKTHCNKEKIEQLLNDWKLQKVEKQKTRPEVKRHFKTIAEEFMKIQIKSRSSTDKIQLQQFKDTKKKSQDKIVEKETLTLNANEKSKQDIKVTESSNTNQSQFKSQIKSNY